MYLCICSTYVCTTSSTYFIRGLKYVDAQVSIAIIFTLQEVVYKAHLWSSYYISTYPTKNVVWVCLVLKYDKVSGGLF